ncbi:MAG: exosortase/archaeosortase family protein [Candidatus Omnitrophota bacterium]
MNIKRMIQIASCSVLLVIAYIPTILWMADRWFAKESYYGHGILIPIVSLVIVWQRWEMLKKIKQVSAMSGLWIVAACLVINIVCASLKIYFVSGFSLVIAIYGMILFFFGKEMVRNLTFPIFFLLAMIPLPLVIIGNLTVKLKLFAAQAATFVLNKVGFPCVRDGSVIVMPHSHTIVEAPCSGLRSLISLLTLGLLFSYIVKTTFVKKAVIFVSSAPIAIVSNIVRIVLLAAVNDLYGEKVAMGFFHDFTGFLVFAIAFAGLYTVSNLLEPKKNAYQ